MEVVVRQNTDEWLLLRRGPQKIRVGGSEAPTICGLSTSVLPHSLYDKMVGELDGTWEDDYEIPAACEHGHRCEPVIAGLYEKLTGNRVEEANYWKHENEDKAIMFGCSPDRKVLVNGEFEGILEIKAPYYIMYDDIKPEHMCQVQYQVTFSFFLYRKLLILPLSDVDNQKTLVRLHGREVASRESGRLCDAGSSSQKSLLQSPIRERVHETQIGLFYAMLEDEK